MLLVNTDYIAGKELEMLGLVNGSTIQSKNIGRDFGAGLKSIVGGELKAYTEMMEEAREIALKGQSKSFSSTKMQKKWARMQLLMCAIPPVRLWQVRQRLWFTAQRCGLNKQAFG